MRKDWPEAPSCRHTQSARSFLFSPCHLPMASSWTRFIPLHIHRTLFSNASHLLPRTYLWTVSAHPPASRILSGLGMYLSSSVFPAPRNAFIHPRPWPREAELRVRWEGRSPGSSTPGARSQLGLAQPSDPGLVTVLNDRGLDLCSLANLLVLSTCDSAPDFRAHISREMDAWQPSRFQ